MTKNEKKRETRFSKHISLLSKEKTSGSVFDLRHYAVNVEHIGVGPGHKIWLYHSPFDGNIMAESKGTLIAALEDYSDGVTIFFQDKKKRVELSYEQLDWLMLLYQLNNSEDGIIAKYIDMSAE